MITGGHFLPTRHVGFGETGALLRERDWDRHPLGPLSEWPRSLRTALDICLASRFPICILWGPERTYFYNDAYAPIVGAKHPRAFGASYPQVWPEIWEKDIRPILESVESTGRASWSDDLLLSLKRHGYAEECYFSFSFAPIPDEEGGVGGVFAAVAETTGRLVGERRLKTLRELAKCGADADDAPRACELAASTLEANRLDAAFSLIYLIDPADGTARLVASSGADAAATPIAVSLAADRGFDPWRFREVLRRGEGVVLNRLPIDVADLRGAPWPERPHTAAIFPLPHPGAELPHGFVVAGVSPRRPFDDDYRTFLSLVAAQIGAGVAHARARREDRRRVEILAEVERAKAAFFDGAGREARSPLASVLGPVEEALRRGATLDAQVRDELENARRNGERLSKLVDALFEASRISSPRPVAAPSNRPSRELGGPEWRANEGSSFPPQKGARVLVVEDQASLRDYVGGMLAFHGFAVERVVDGARALEAIRASSPELVVADAATRGLDGYGWIAALRNDPATSEIPILIVAAGEAEEAREKAVAAGANACLAEAFVARELIPRASALIGVRRLRFEAARRERELSAVAQANRNRLELVLSAVRDQFLSVDASFRYTYVNDRVVEMHGRSRGELLGRSLWETFPDLAGTVFETEVRRAMTERAPARFECRFGSLNRWFETRVYPTDDGGLSLFAADVTERRSSEERSKKLAEAGFVLLESRDGETTLTRLAELLVPTFADWCVIDLLQPRHSQCRRIAVRTSRKDKEAVARELEVYYAPDLRDAHPIRGPVDSGRTEFSVDVGPAWKLVGENDARHAVLLDEMDITDAIMVPLFVRRCVAGVLTLIASRWSGRRFGPEDVLAAEELGRRASVALENATLHREATSPFWRVM
jgi:PAS domain S-box-containing protein